MAGKRKRPGDPLNLSSDDWNSFLDAAEKVLGGKGNRRDNSHTIPMGNQDVLLKNTTGADLAQFGIVGLGSVTPSPSNLIEFKQQTHQFDGVAISTPDHYGRWGVAQEPIKNNAVGRVRIAGIAIVQVSGDVPASYPYLADCDTAASLEFREAGNAQVLYYDESTEWAIVRICNALPCVVKSVEIATVMGAKQLQYTTLCGDVVKIADITEACPE